MNNIKKLLKAKDMTLEDLAGLVGYSSRHMRYLMNNEREPNRLLAREIAYILTGDGDERNVWP